MVNGALDSNGIRKGDWQWQLYEVHLKKDTNDCDVGFDIQIDENLVVSRNNFDFQNVQN